MVIVGEKERTDNTVSVRDRSLGEGKDAELGAMPLAELVRRLSEEVRQRRIRQVSTAGASLADTGAQYAE